MKVLVLADARDWLSIWQLPVILAMAAAWLFLGGYLMHRVVKPIVARRESQLNRCLIVALLAEIGGGIAGAIAGALATIIAKANNIEAIWLVLPAAAVVFCLISFLTVFASFKLPGRDTCMLWLKSFGPPLILSVVVAVPTVWLTYSARETARSRNTSAYTLQYIYEVIFSRYGVDNPPASLQEMITHKVVEANKLAAYSHPSRKVGFFYKPAPLEARTAASKKLLACDWADNQSGGYRAVLYTNGQTDILDADAFSALLERPENKGFAEALKKAEKKLPPAN